MVQEYIKHYRVYGETICDPFCGSGVTAVESLVLGRRAIATDINPVARFITRMTAVSPVHISELREAYNSVSSTVQGDIQSLDSMSEPEIFDILRKLSPPRTPIPRTVRRAGASTVNQLHTPRQLAGLTILRDAINHLRPGTLRDLLLVALLNTARYANRTYEGRATGSQYRGQGDLFAASAFRLLLPSALLSISYGQHLSAALSRLLEAKEETNLLIGDRYERDLQLANVPASAVHTICGEDSVDYCFTDPPYSNDINFLDLSAFWAAWLGCEISPSPKKSELGGDQATRSFEAEFDVSVESISRCLKTDRWFTLVYKHTDLSLWESIVAACERHGLRYVNSVWQDLKIRSTRQIENPDINPKGDMYLNFRKMSRRSLEIAYPTALILDLPTFPNYIEKEIERLIVSYLGADIKLIASRLIQELLDTWATAHEHDRNPETLTKDIATVIRSARFVSKTSQRGESYWLLSDEVSPDPSLPLFDRARYCLFAFLRKSGEASEGESSRYLLTQCTGTTGALGSRIRYSKPRKGGRRKDRATSLALRRGSR